MGAGLALTLALHRGRTLKDLPMGSGFALIVNLTCAGVVVAWLAVDPNSEG